MQFFDLFEDEASSSEEYNDDKSDIVHPEDSAASIVSSTKQYIGFRLQPNNLSANWLILNASIVSIFENKQSSL